MKRLALLLTVTTCAIAMSGCLSPKGITPDEKRSYTQGVYEETLDMFYAKEPSLEKLVAQSAGHVVFSSIDGQYLLFGGGNGFGLAVSGSDQTYLKRIELALGFGLGVRSYRTLFVFRDAEAFRWFVDRGWDASGDLAAAFQTGDRGGSVSMAGNPRAGMQVWELTDSGVILKAAVTGTKAWRDSATE